MANHIMFRADNMAGTHDGRYLASVRIGASDMDNGMLVALDDYETGAREVRTVTTPTATTPKGKLAILGSEEVDREKTFDTIREFTNKAKSIARAYVLADLDVFSVTEGAFDANPSVGKIIEAQAGNKMKVTDSLTASSTKIGECIAVETDGDTTWYVIRVTD